MGWSSGSRLFSEVWGAVRDIIPGSRRVVLCQQVIEAFEQEDCDTVCECFDDRCPEIEEAYYAIHPDEDVDES